MWEIDLSGQIYTMLLSILLGAGYGLVFDIASTSYIEKSKTVIFFSDIIFFTLLAFFQFCFFLARCNGEIRGYVFICEIIGFLIYKKTLSRPICFLFGWIRKTLSRLLNILSSRILEPLTLFFYKILKNILKIFRKSGKKLKKG